MVHGSAGPALSTLAFAAGGVVMVVGGIVVVWEKQRLKARARALRKIRPASGPRAAAPPARAAEAAPPAAPAPRPAPSQPSPSAPPAPFPPAASSPPQPALSPLQQEYARERLLPAAGRTDRDISAPAPLTGDGVIIYPDVLEPAPRRRLASGLLFLCRAAVLLCCAGLSALVFTVYDGAAVARRFYVLAMGAPVSGVVEGLEAAPSAGMLRYVLTFDYDSPGGRERGQALVGESARTLAARGQTVPLHVLRTQDRVLVALDEDYGFGGQRAALLLAVAACLIVGGWSFAFRVLQP